jgi:hypothetical protein
LLSSVEMMRKIDHPKKGLIAPFFELDVFMPHE